MIILQVLLPFAGQQIARSAFLGSFFDNLWMRTLHSRNTRL